MTEEMRSDLVFSAASFVCLIPAWLPTIWNRKVWPALKVPMIAVTVGVLTQLLFINLVTLGALTLDYSLKFAIVGIPCSGFPLLMLQFSDPRKRFASAGVVVSSLFTITFWLFLITLH